MSEKNKENALRQYVELYEAHKELTDSHSAGCMNALREEALRALRDAELPRKGSEDHEHIDLGAILGEDYGVNLQRVMPDINPAESFHCAVPNLSTCLYLNLNDIALGRRGLGGTEARGNSPELGDSGVLAGSLKEIGQEYAELTAQYYGKLANLDNPLTALNTLLAQDGFMLYVPKGVKVEKPIQLVNILQSQMPQMAVRRMLVVLEEDAEAQVLVCDHTQPSDTAVTALQTIEIFAGKGSKFDLYDMEESTENTRRLSTLYLRQEEGSNVLIDGITLFNGITRNEYDCTFAGEHAELHLLGMGIEDDARMLSTHSMVRHDKGHCHTDELFKYVVDDQAVGDFSGRIYVAPGAVKTTAYQSNRNIVGSDEARMYSKPQLEIYNDDVKCSHGTAIGQLDEMQLFYMRTRGLDEREAKLLLKQAFMSDVVDGVRLEILRERLRQLVERRFAGHPASCGRC